MGSCAVMGSHVRRKSHEVMGDHEVGVAAFLHKILLSNYCVSFIRHDLVAARNLDSQQ